MTDISVDYETQTGSMVSLRMGRVVERKLTPEQAEPLKVELASFVDFGPFSWRAGRVR